MVPPGAIKSAMPPSNKRISTGARIFANTKGACWIEYAPAFTSSTDPSPSSNCPKELAVLNMRQPLLHRPILAQAQIVGG